ncbi:hypothetical protein XENOCAPTIV_019985 [Xenoophorus captivus]|uniref:Uncharacterized protein n=1 Tax=Xenoophorus captivus TaxID=1517983 RepID=A0ABV0R189_9TELE
MKRKMIATGLRWRTFLVCSCLQLKDDEESFGLAAEVAITTFEDDICDDYQLSKSPSPTSSKRIRMHYSFDYAQQMHFPSNPLQPGPMYFTISRKCGLFGVFCEDLQKKR